MQIQQKFLTPNRYSRPQTSLKKITKIAVHYIGNPNTSAIANRNYFNNLSTSHATYASCHYIIGLEGEIIQCIPENEIAYCTNQANSYSISIENCHPDSTGKFTQQTLTSLIELCADLCKRYNLNPLTDIIRHYDVTKKCCPRWWAPNGPNKNANADFTAFRQQVKQYMERGNIKEDDEVIETINISINGKDIKVDAIIKDDNTYIKLRSLENAGFTIGYNADTKTRTLDNNIISLPLIINEDGVYDRIAAINIKNTNYVPIRSIGNITNTFDTDYIDGKVIIKTKDN